MSRKEPDYTTQPIKTSDCVGFLPPRVWSEIFMSGTLIVIKSVPRISSSRFLRPVFSGQDCDARVPQKTP